tara:strand:- start:106 stop:549 length:444 start_codon:yes stop_codon:yes gene_type:complete
MIKKVLLIFPISLILIASCSGEIETKSDSQLYLKCDVRNNYGIGYVNILFINDNGTGSSRRLSVEYSYSRKGTLSNPNELYNKKDISSHNYDEDVDLYYWNPTDYEFAQVNRKTLEFRWTYEFQNDIPERGFPITGQCRIANTDNII